MNTAIEIKNYLRSNGVSQAFICRKTKINSAKLSLALNGKRRITFAEYENICWALNVGVETFLTPCPPCK